NYGGRNIGNGALILGLERVLQEDFEGPVAFTGEAWDDYTRGLKRFDEGFVELVNCSDGLVVGAALTFDGRPAFGETGMRFDLPHRLWPRIERPVVFYGLSHRTISRFDAYHHA